MRLLYKLLKLDPDSREGMISATSALGIIINVLIALTKVIIGTLASSIAIISEGVNNAADALTSILTLLGSKLAGRHPDEKHPFGYGRIEYLTALVVSVLILISGIETLKSAVELIFKPEPVSISYLSLIIVAGSAVVKFFLANYTIAMGRKTGSSSLEAVGLECRGDCYASIVTILTAAVFLLFGFSLDAYAGVFTSALIIKAGAEVLLDTVSELIGRPGENELALKLYNEIRNTKGVIGAADMMLHNYGPDAYSGSVNIEIDHNLSVGEAYDFIHAMQLRIMHEYHVTMVFGIYAVDNDSTRGKEVRKCIAQYVRNKEHVKSYHAVYFDDVNNKLYCDLIVDYQLKDWQQLEDDFKIYMKQHYPNQDIVLTIETEFV